MVDCSRELAKDLGKVSTEFRGHLSEPSTILLRSSHLVSSSSFQGHLSKSAVCKQSKQARIFMSQLIKRFARSFPLSRPYRTTVRVMSKKGGAGKGKKNVPTESSAPAPNTGPVLVDAKTGNLIVKILAKPGAKTSGITDVSKEGVGCQIAAPPIDGEANTELMRYLSKLLELRKSDISLDRGSKSRQKTIVLDKDGCRHTREQLLTIFRTEASSGS